MLVNNEDVQREVLGKLSGQLQLYRDAYEHKRDVARLAAEVEQITALALNFESILHDSMGPFQGLIAEIARADDRIGESLAEIERLSFQLQQNRQDVSFALDPGDRTLMDYLVHVRMKQDLIGEVLDRISDPRTSLDELDFSDLLGPKPEGAPPVLETTLSNVQDLVEVRLEKFFAGFEKKSADSEPGLGAVTQTIAIAELVPESAKLQHSETARVCWTQSVAGRFLSAPTATPYGILAGSVNGNLLCLDSETGETIWQVDLGNALSTSPTNVDDVVFIGQKNGYLVCASASSGETIWRFKTGGRIEADSLPAGSRMYVGSLDGNFYCLDTETGDEIWRFPAGAGIAAKPIARLANGSGLVFFGCNDSLLYAVDAGTGKSVFTVKTGSRISGPPAMLGDMLIWGSNDGKLYACESATGLIRWTFDTRSSRIASPLVLPEQRIVAFGARNSQVYFVGVEDGQLIGTLQPESAVENCPVQLGSTVVFADKGGNIYGVEPDGSRELWRVGLGAVALTAPVVEGRRIYVGSRDGNIFALKPPDFKEEE